MAQNGTTPKRARTDGGDASNINFKLAFDNPAAFTQMMVIVGNVLPEIEVFVSAGGDFTGVSIKSIDTKQVCMVISRVECGVELRPGIEQKDLSFRLKTKAILTCLRTVPSNYTMTLCQYEDDPSIHIKSTDGETFNDEVSFAVNTIVPQNNPPALSNLEYDFNINMDLVTLKTLIKMCKDLKAEDTVFQVRTKKEGHGSGSEPQSYFALKAAGEDVKIERKFVSMNNTVDGDDASVVQTVGQVDPDACKTIQEDLYDTSCSESFSTEYLGLFVKSMEKNTVNLRLSNKKPLLINCQLDSDKSMVCFILAPRDE